MPTKTTVRLNAMDRAVEQQAPCESNGWKDYETTLGRYRAPRDGLHEIARDLLQWWWGTFEKNKWRVNLKEPYLDLVYWNYDDTIFHNYK